MLKHKKGTLINITGPGPDQKATGCGSTVTDRHGQQRRLREERKSNKGGGADKCTECDRGQTVSRKEVETKEGRVNGQTGTRG